jgi:hypothetical protein
MTPLRAIGQPRLRWIVTVALLASLTGLVLSQVGAADAAGSPTAGAATARAGTSQESPSVWINEPGRCSGPRPDGPS